MADFVYYGADAVFYGADEVTYGVPTTTSAPAATEVTSAVWTWAVGPSGSTLAPGPTRQLTAATGRVVTWRVDGHAFAQFTINGRHDEAAGIVERRDDLWVHRDGALVFRGRIVGAEDTIDQNGHSVKFSAVDYRAMLTLAAKVEPPAPTYTTTDAAQIVWDLVETWQARTAGDWGITEGVGATAGITPQETDITPFTPVGEVIDRLLRRENGGEWEISPTLELNRWWPTRGTVSGAVLDYGGVLSSMARSLPEFGNVAGATGDEGTAAVTATHASLGTDGLGRWTVAQAFPTETRQANVAAKAAWLLDQAVTVESAWRATFTAGRWDGPDYVWIGDTVELRVQSGRLVLDGVQRVVELQAVCGDHGGTEIISVGLVGVAA